jgi:protein-S-isoprenylcysteine O-methyltransferase Ste14
MDGIAQIGLVVCWILWAWPFLAYKARTPKRPADVTVKASRWGIGLQMVGYFCVFFVRPGSVPVSRPPAVLAAGLLIGCLAVLCSWAGVRSLGKQLRVQAGLYADHELVRSGPYRIVRHPIYAGMLATYLATALIRASWPMALIGLVFLIAGLEIRVRIEDGLLASRFGKQFADYKASVPAYIPFVR